jgi:hypothetical protein
MNLHLLLLSWLALTLAFPPANAAGPASATPEAIAPALVVRGAVVFDGREVLPDTDVLVHRGLIARGGAPGKRLLVPGDMPVVDGHGRTLMPA